MRLKSPVVYCSGEQQGSPQSVKQGWVASRSTFKSLQWRHNGRDGVSNHQPHNYLLNRLYRRRSKKTSNLCVTGLCEHKGPVTRKMFPFHDVIKCKNKMRRQRMLLAFSIFNWKSKHQSGVFPIPQYDLSLSCSYDNEKLVDKDLNLLALHFDLIRRCKCRDHSG